MPIRKIYTLKAAPDRAPDLLRALRILAEKLTPLEGNQGVEILANVDDQEIYVFVEHWATSEAQKAAGALLGRAAFADIGPTLDSPPVTATLTPVDDG